MSRTAPAKTAALLLAMSVSACVEPNTTQVDPVVTAPAPAQEQTPSVAFSDPVVNPGFRGGGGSWEGFGDILFRYTAIERNGEIYICGAFTGRGARSIRRLSREVMRQATAEVNGRVLRRDMRFFREASNSALNNGLVGTETNCASTGEPAGSVPLPFISVETHPGRYSVSG